MTDTTNGVAPRRYRAGFVLDLDLPGEYVTIIEHQVWASSPADAMDRLAEHIDALADIERDEEPLPTLTDVLNGPTVTVTLNNIHDWRDGPSGSGSADLRQARGASAHKIIVDEVADWVAANPARNAAAQAPTWSVPPAPTDRRCLATGTPPTSGAEKRCTRSMGHPVHEPHVWLEAFRSPRGFATLAVWFGSDPIAMEYRVPAEGVQSSPPERLAPVDLDTAAATFQGNEELTSLVKVCQDLEIQRPIDVDEGAPGEGYVHTVGTLADALKTEITNGRARLGHVRDELRRAQATINTLEGRLTRDPSKSYITVPRIRLCQNDGKLVLGTDPDGRGNQLRECECGKPFLSCAPIFTRAADA